MNGIDSKESEYALLQIKDGFVFEDFAKNFLSQILSYDFLPVGGHKDRGIDGLEHTFSRKGTERHVYQMSIEAKPDDKLKRTLDTLVENKINFDRLTYVTNQDVNDKDLLIDLTCTRKITPSEWRESTKVKIGDSSNEKEFYG